MARGDKRAFVAAHLELSNAEISELATTAGLQMSADAVSQHRRKLASKRKPRASKPQPKRTGKRKAVGKQPAARAAATTNGTGDGATMTVKESQLRRLIFELGFDAARAVFHEFEQLHQTMR